MSSSTADSAGDTSASLPYKCGGCGEPILRGDGEPHLSPSHSCVFCQKKMHSYLMCDAVWMPVENQYFCAASCIRQFNKNARKAHCNAEKAGDPPVALPVVYPVARRPGADTECNGAEVQCDKDTEVIDVNDKSSDDDDSDAESNNDDAEDSDQEQDESVSGEDTSQQDSSNVPPAANIEAVGGEQNGSKPENQHDDIESMLRALIPEGARVQVAFKQEDDDQEGIWWGAIVGAHSANKAHVFLAYDDGELKCHPREELRDLLQQGKLKALNSDRGLVSGETVPEVALSVCHIRVNKKILPLGVLLGEGNERLCGQPIYIAHILFLDVVRDIKDANVGFNHRALRQRYNSLATHPCTLTHTH